MTVTQANPYLSVPDAIEAVEFYKKAFDAVEVGPCLKDPDGNVVHHEIKVGEATIMLASENPDFGNVGPKTLGGTTVRLNLEVTSADDVAKQAVAAGATLLIPIADQFYGYRSGRIADPYGHEWILSQKLEELSQEEMQSRLDAMYKA